MYPESVKRLSDVLQPFCHVKCSQLRARAQTDPDLTALVHEYKLDASQFAMAYPNMNAIYEDLYKYSYASTTEIPSEDEDWVVEVVTEMCAPVLGDRFSPETFAEAVGYVNRDTSPGFPENLKYASKGEWLDDKSLDHEMIAKRYAATGVCTGNCSFKEEVRPLEKLEQEKARSFISGNIVENIVWLMYCGPLFRAIAENWRHLPVTYGLSELHRGWHFLLERLRSWLGFKTDMKQCDGSLDYAIQRVVGRIFKVFVKDESPAPGWPKAHEMIDRLIKSNCRMWIKLPTGIIFLKKHGNSSGCGATIQINSFAQLVIVLLFLRSRGLTKDEILKNFEFQCHGDDGRFAAKGEYVKFLDFGALNNYWKARGKNFRFEVENESPERLEFLPWLSRLTRWFEDTFVPYPKDPAKLLASAVLRNRVPKGVEPHAYVMSRWWQLTNQLVFVPDSNPVNFDSMTAIGNEYSQLCEKRMPELKNNQDWVNAHKHRKPRWWLCGQHTSTRKLIPQLKAIVPNRSESFVVKITLGVRLILLRPSESMAKGQKGLKSKAKAVAKVLKKVKKITKKQSGAKKNKSIVKGHGNFFTDAWNTVRKVGKNVLGQGIHKGIDWLSGRAHDAIKSVVGHGDYHMSGAPVVENSMFADSAVVPKFGNAGNANRLQHREPLGKVFSSIPFQRNTITLNPGLTVFPWLSEIAHAFQRYKFHGAIIEFVSSVSPLSADASGRVVLSTRYDLSSAAPSSIQEAEIAFGSVPSRPMDNMAMPIECKLSMQAVNCLNIRFGALPAGANAQFFDHCFVDICNEGQSTTGSTLLGEIYITFDIEFLMPIAEHLTNATIQSFAAYGAVSTANPYSTGMTTRTGQMMPVTLTAAAGALTVDLDATQPLPIGSTWVCQWAVSLGAGTGVTSSSARTLAADLVNYNLYKDSNGNDTSIMISSVVTVTARIEIITFAFRVASTSTNQSILINGAVFDAAATGYGVLTITPVTSGLSEARMRARYPGLYVLQDSMEQKYDEMYMKLGVLQGREDAAEKLLTTVREESSDDEKFDVSEERRMAAEERHLRALYKYHLPSERKNDNAQEVRGGTVETSIPRVADLSSCFVPAKGFVQVDPSLKRQMLLQALEELDNGSIESAVILPRGEDTTAIKL